jgi:hypothetical protein
VVIALELELLQIIGLLVLVTVIPLYRGWQFWLLHKSRRAVAEAEGWRYSDQGWRIFFSSTYSLAGTTGSGLVWHFRRDQKGRRWLFDWSSQNNLLPYGVLHMLPQEAGKRRQQKRSPHLRAVAVGSQAWQEQYKFIATHAILSERVFSEEADRVMLEYPSWPAPGALEEIVWNQKELFIRVRYKNDWPTVRRIVRLGTVLVENAARM